MTQLYDAYVAFVREAIGTIGLVPTMVLAVLTMAVGVFMLYWGVRLLNWRQ